MYFPLGGVPRGTVYQPYRVLFFGFNLQDQVENHHKFKFADD